VSWVFQGVTSELVNMVKKMFTRKSEVGVTELDLGSTRYAPKITMEEYNTGVNRDTHLQTHLQPSLHTPVLTSKYSLERGNTKAENGDLQQKPTKTENKKAIPPRLNLSQDSYAANIYYQLLPVLAANIGSLSSGLALGYSAVLLPQIRPDEDSLYDQVNTNRSHVNHTTTRHRPFTVDMEEGSWIAGIFGLGAIFGGLLSAYLGNQYGRRISLILLAIPDLLGWILMASSQNLGMMLVGRLLAGFAAAGYSPNIQIFVAEITQPQHRGWLSGLTIPITAIGVLTMLWSSFVAVIQITMKKCSKFSNTSKRILKVFGF